MFATDACIAPPLPRGGWGGQSVASKKEIDITSSPDECYRDLRSAIAPLVMAAIAPSHQNGLTKKLGFKPRPSANAQEHVLPKLRRS